MAKQIKFNLVIDGNKVSTFEEMQDNLSAELLPHLPTGKLAKWFLSRELADKAAAVQAIDTTQTNLAQLTALCEVLELEADEDILADILAMPEQLAQAQAAQIQETTAAPEVEEESYTSKPSYREDWSGRDLSGRSFKDEDFSNYNFAGANLSGCDFSGANLEGANFEGAILQGCSFGSAGFLSFSAGADLTNASFKNCNLSGTSFDYSTLVNANFKECYTEQNACCSFHGANCTYSIFDKCNLFVEFSCTYLTNASFKESVLRREHDHRRARRENEIYLAGADFSFADLTGFSFYEAIDKDKAKFTGAKMK
jgi:uncharacterized protein YjbI with pentapeptide repeats